MLEEGKNNYLCAVATGKNRCGVCFADVSTGECLVTELRGRDVRQKLVDQLGKFSPSEILLCQNSLQLKYHLEAVKEAIGCRAVKLVGDQFGREENEARILAQFDAIALSDLQLEGRGRVRPGPLHPAALPGPHPAKRGLPHPGAGLLPL